MFGQKINYTKAEGLIWQSQVLANDIMMVIIFRTVWGAALPQSRPTMRTGPAAGTARDPEPRPSALGWTGNDWGRPIKNFSVSLVGSQGETMGRSRAVEPRDGRGADLPDPVPRAPSGEAAGQSSSGGRRPRRLVRCGGAAEGPL